MKNKTSFMWCFFVLFYKIDVIIKYLKEYAGYNQEVISYIISKSPNLEQRNDMLNKAFDNKNLEGLIFHSDHGWQYQYQSYQQRLKNKTKYV